MDGQDQELHFENTPLENLRTILSEADASMQTPSAPVSRPDEATVSKADLRKAAERLAAEPQQFIAPSLIRQILAGLGPRRIDPASAQNIFENRHVLQLDKVIRSKIQIIY
jgi:hypothetical protein